MRFIHIFVLNDEMVPIYQYDKIVVITYSLNYTKMPEITPKIIQKVYSITTVNVLVKKNIFFTA